MIEINELLMLKRVRIPEEIVRAQDDVPLKMAIA